MSDIMMMGWYEGGMEECIPSKIEKNPLLSCLFFIRLHSRATQNTDQRRITSPTRSWYTPFHYCYVCYSWQNTLDGFANAMIDHTDCLFGGFRQP